MLRKILRNVLSLRPIASRCINPVLRLHNAAYKLAGHMAMALEADGLHPKHRLMDYHAWFAERLDPSWTVLDVGCGNGALAADLSGHCRHIAAVDIDPENIGRAKRENACRNISYLLGDATTYSFNGRFDAILLSNVLEHIEDRIRFLQRLSRLAPRFLVRVPMVDRDWITLYKRERDVSYRLDPSHFIEYTADLLAEELGSAGFRIVEHRVRYGELYAVCESTGRRDLTGDGRGA